MGGATVTIQENTLAEAIVELTVQIKDAEMIPLWLDSVTLLVKNKKGKYIMFGDNGREVFVGTSYTQDEHKNFVIFAHFGK